MVKILLADAAKQGYKPDSTVAADMVRLARPYPHMVFQNMVNLGLYPVQSVVKVDDTVDGILEGLNAGTWTIGLAKTGNYMAMTEEELSSLEQSDPKRYNEMLRAAQKKLSDAGANYVVDDITQVPAVIQDINLRLTHGEQP